MKKSMLKTKRSSPLHHVQLRNIGSSTRLTSSTDHAEVIHLDSRNIVIVDHCLRFSRSIYDRFSLTNCSMVIKLLRNLDGDGTSKCIISNYATFYLLARCLISCKLCNDRINLRRLCNDNCCPYKLLIFLYFLFLKIIFNLISLIGLKMEIHISLCSGTLI